MRWRGYLWSFPNRRETTRSWLPWPSCSAETALPQTRHGESSLEALSCFGLLLLGMLGTDIPPQLLKEVPHPSFFHLNLHLFPQAPAPHSSHIRGTSAQLPWAQGSPEAATTASVLRTSLLHWGTQWEVKLTSYRPSKRKELHFRTYPKISCSFWKYFSFMFPKERKYSTK